MRSVVNGSMNGARGQSIGRGVRREERQRQRQRQVKEVYGSQKSELATLNLPREGYDGKVRLRA